MLCVVDRFVVQRVRDGDNVSLKRSKGGVPGIGSSATPFAVHIVAFQPGNITDVPDNADSSGTWNDWPNATVSQTVAVAVGSTVVVDVTISGSLREPDVLVYVRTSISVDGGSTWTPGGYSGGRLPTGTYDWVETVTARQALSSVASGNVVVKAQYYFTSASDCDAIDFYVVGTVTEIFV